MTESLQYELENEDFQFTVFCPGNVRTAIFGDMAAPADSVSVDEAVEYIFGEMEKKSLNVIFPESMRQFEKLFRRSERILINFHAKSPMNAGRITARKGTYY
ncbi:hypothetical protein MASR1M66_05910 [Aminivibrio sp.]